MADKSASVDVRYDRNLVFFQILIGNLLRAPVGAYRRKFAHHQSLDIRTRGFIVFRVGAVIADLWIGKDYDLPGVRRIGEDLLVSGDGSVKNNFPVTLCFGSVTFASEDAAIFERKDRLHADSGGVDFIDSSSTGRKRKRFTAADEWKARHHSLS